MNSRKARYSCVVVCFSVLLGFSWTAPAAAGDAADLRFAAGPSRGGAGTSTLVPLQDAKAKPVVMPVVASEPWEVLWMDVWQKSNQIYRIGVADTLKQAPGCMGNLGLEVIVAQTVRAVRDRKFGDAVNYMAQFQDRSLCLNLEGVRGLDAALSRYTERAIKELPADQQRVAIHGTFNLGMLTYDQISDTGRSWWGGIVGFMYYPQMVAQMNAYPAQDLGLWSYNFQNGRLVQSASKQALLDKLATLANPVIGYPAGGTAGGIPSGPTGSGNSGTGFMAGSAGTGAGVVGCLVAASGSTGGRGMVTCMQKATGFHPSVGDVLAGPFDPGVSVRDPQCALMSTGGESSENTSDKKVPPTSDDRSIFKKGWDYLWSTPPPPPPPPPPPCKGCTPIPPEDRRPKPPGNWRTVQGDPGDVGVVGGACGNASNAARRAQAVYDCYQGSGSGGATTPPGVIDPTRALTTDPQTSGLAAGFMACLSQGGSLVRNGLIDSRCAAARCVQGEPCSCETAAAGSGGGAGGGVGVYTGVTPPDCMNPDAPCGPGITPPGPGGALPGAPKPPGNPPPAPPPQPMTGTVSPPTTFVPATRGIGTAPLLQQQKGTTPVSPLQQIGR